MVESTFQGRSYPRMISTSFEWNGVHEMHTDDSSGRSVAAASSVTEMEEVLEARMVVSEKPYPETKYLFLHFRFSLTSFHDQVPWRVMDS
jgi:hypothetical protein